MVVISDNQGSLTILDALFDTESLQKSLINRYYECEPEPNPEVGELFLNEMNYFVNKNIEAEAEYMTKCDFMEKLAYG